MFNKNVSKVVAFDLYEIFNYDSPLLMSSAIQKKYTKHDYARSNLLVTQTENLKRKFYTVQYVK